VDSVSGAGLFRDRDSGAEFANARKTVLTKNTPLELPKNRLSLGDEVLRDPISIGRAAGDDANAGATVAFIAVMMKAKKKIQRGRPHVPRLHTKTTEISGDGDAMMLIWE
jgi:hypothetical protein